jgi:ketosteroid isomerase-like protein
MTEHPNVQRMREAYDAFAKGDLEALREYWMPDIRWHVPGHTDISGDYEGTDAVFGFLGQVFERSGGTFRVEPIALLADDRYGAAIVLLTGRREDRDLRVQNSQVCRFEGDRVAEFWDTSSDPDALDRFFG